MTHGRRGSGPGDNLAGQRRLGRDRSPLAKLRSIPKAEIQGTVKMPHFTKIKTRLLEVGLARFNESMRLRGMPRPTLTVSRLLN